MSAMVDHCALTTELLERDNHRTPDFLEFKYREHIPVFVYGTLKSGGPLNHVLKDCPLLGDAGISVNAFTMFFSKQGFPVILPAEKDKGKKIYGELYVCKPTDILELDYIEGNTQMYDRKEMWVWAYDQNFKKNGRGGNPAIKAMVYVGNPYFWQGRDVVAYPTTNVRGVPAYDYKHGSVIPNTYSPVMPANWE